ncbi:Ferredoxin subunit of nitrite reductase or a ring-hydroxylating dioxygenase [Tistlia consotensis]|uniref:Ferredoxin subunit of nitrite reductase or a ring-hydroxylating dioxygenase n=1 Tax=Tistlia consotensis USBA 355 TaxID=560819 RepID=A0A1Y6BWV9_9PROT|nr:Rieske 2Fe-2S domain-containing protein [Tistlia consotensis]SMF32024.1 Ferredoxin subunit of nitrite reductase or a ring-hydroxylating dioxygenase [Tistlia consotensis USBA 355]SNR67991.1 Ferredoxin subunit of nitrite reductase or a ring-hydroxylating dioxygenase [Tistlia consotensis]
MEPQWHEVAHLDSLPADGRRLVRVEGRQIALFRRGEQVWACNNRCPHEGYPLIEGTVSPAEGCVLTCNWHNWKFDLVSGETLIGGDSLRRYPVRLDGGRVLLDLAEPRAEARREAALAGIAGAFERNERDRMARELARLQRAGGDPLEAIRRAVTWTHDRFEFGTTHALAALPDWLALRERWAGTPAERLVPLVEVLDHLNWDSLRRPSYPFAEDRAPWSPEALVAAIEAEDEPAAVAVLRGGLAEGRSFAELEASFAAAALAHYQDFGHSAIYTLKAGQAIARLGPEVAEPVLFALVRSLVSAECEDLIPEFRAYGPAFAAWDGRGDRPVAAADFRGLGVRQALARCLESSGRPDELHAALLGAAAGQWLRFDLSLDRQQDNPVSRNVNWLDFTHAVTFANAVRHLAARHPAVRPAGLLQIACFLGRNTTFLDPAVAEAGWAVAEPEAFLAGRFRALFDHAVPEPIISAHLVKVLTAVEEEWQAFPEAPWRGTLLAATRRFLDNPPKRRHGLRVANQALDFVEAE